jgi:hypothetical protein
VIKVFGEVEVVEKNVGEVNVLVLGAVVELNTFVGVFKEDKVDSCRLKTSEGAVLVELVV